MLVDGIELFALRADAVIAFEQFDAIGVELLQKDGPVSSTTSLSRTMLLMSSSLSVLR